MDQIIEVEEWKSVVGYEGLYSISSFGRVRRDIKMHAKPAGGFLKPHEDRNGYQFARLRKNRVTRELAIHRLVLTAFHCEAPEGHEVDHIDHNTSNNHKSNLRWITHVENVRRSFARPDRYIPNGEKIATAVLAEDDVRMIRRMRRHGFSHKEVIEHLLAFKGIAVDKATVSRAANRKTWKHVE